MNKYSIWIIISVMMCFLTIQVQSGGGKKEKIHFKIEVPKFVNKEYHTKTIYVHVHDKEPEKKEHHHEHDHKHVHHGGHGGGKEHKHHGGGHKKHHGHHDHHGHKHGKDDGIGYYHYDFHSYHDDHGYHDSYDHHDYDHDRSSPDSVNYIPYKNPNPRSQYISKPPQKHHGSNHVEREPKRQRHYNDLNDAPKTPTYQRQPQNYHYNSYPYKGNKNNYNNPNHIQDSNNLHKPEAYGHKSSPVKHKSNHGQYTQPPIPVPEKIIPVHEMPEKGEHVTEVRNQNYEFVGYKNDDPPYFHVQMEPKEYDSYERVINMDDPSKSTFSFGPITNPYPSHYQDNSEKQEDTSEEDENAKVSSIEDEFNIPYEKYAKEQKPQTPHYQSIQQHTPSRQSAPQQDITYNSYGYPIGGTDAPFKITQNSYNEYSYPPISGNTYVRDNTGQSIPAEELLSQEYSRYMDANKQIQEDYSVDGPYDTNSDEFGNYDFDGYSKKVVGDETRNNKGATVLYRVNGDPINNSESNIKSLRIRGKPKNVHTHNRNQFRLNY